LAEYVGPFEEGVLRPEPVELRIAHEVVIDPLLVRRRLGPRRYRHRNDRPRASILRTTRQSLGHRFGDRGLADTGGTRDDQEQAGPVLAGLGGRQVWRTASSRRKPGARA